MTKPDHSRSRWWVDCIMLLVIVSSTFCILLVGGHGIAFVWQIFADRPADAFCSPFGLPMCAALLLPASSFLPFTMAAVLRWLCLLLLTGFLIFVGMMTEHPEWTQATSAPLLLAFFIQLARTIRLQRPSQTPASS